MDGIYIRRKRMKKTKKRETKVVAASKPAERTVMTTNSSTSPYSLNATLDFLTNNAGLLFLGLSLLVVGFLSGAMWRENTMLRAGLGGGTPTAQLPTGQQPTDPGAAAPVGPISDADWKAVQENPAGVIGNKNAKVAIVEFTDYQCPFCSRHYTTAYKSIKEKYVDTGKVKIILKDQPLPFHPNAKISANAARCAGEQGKFEAMHDALFTKQTEWSSLANDAAITKFGEIATAAGLDGNKVVDCVKAGKYNKQIEEDSALGTKVGASGTPSFFVNKELIVGAQDFAVFETALERALKG
jgi:protein-disulfide isomerase